MRVGILDVGSNTARLLIADVNGTRLEPVTTGRAHLGLGAEIAERGTLRRKTIAAAARVCRKHADRARELGVERAQVIVTAPGRQGTASAALVGALHEATRLPVRILAADDEGQLAYEGAVASLSGNQPSRIAVVDVGGGSTELVVGPPGFGPMWLRSLDLGSLRLTRLALPSDPPTARELARDVGIDPSRTGTLLAGALLLGEASRTLGRPLRLARGGLREGAALALAAETVARAA